MRAATSCVYCAQTGTYNKLLASIPMVCPFTYTLQYNVPYRLPPCQPVFCLPPVFLPLVS